jgi:hypothetical protein
MTIKMIVRQAGRYGFGEVISASTFSLLAEFLGMSCRKRYVFYKDVMTPVFIGPNFNGDF